MKNDVEHGAGEMGDEIFILLVLSVKSTSVIPDYNLIAIVQSYCSLLSSSEIFTHE